MIIVSQDKDLILNFKNIDAIGIGNPLDNDNGLFKVLASTTSDNEYTLGKYETEERAKEVLQEIINRYKKPKILQETLDTYQVIKLNNEVFQIPKE